MGTPRVIRHRGLPPSSEAMGSRERRHRAMAPMSHSPLSRNATACRAARTTSNSPQLRRVLACSYRGDEHVGGIDAPSRSLYSAAKRSAVETRLALHVPNYLGVRLLSLCVYSLGYVFHFWQAALRWLTCRVCRRDLSVFSLYA